MKRKSSDDAGATLNKTPKLSVIPSFNSVKDALDFLYESFPSFNFKQPIRPIIVKSQLYALVHNRTAVDANLNALQNSSEIRLLKLEDQVDDSVAIMRAVDYRKSFEDISPNEDERILFQKFCDLVIDKNRHLTVVKQTLSNYFTDKEISLLVQCGALTIRSPGCWWISAPSAGRFLTAYRNGQDAILRILRRKRFKELLLSDIVNRDLGKKIVLGASYHVLAHIGAGTLISVPTSSGPLVRLRTG
ncbi:unnamed protein product [Calicophoron daubneyi]|uniref:Serine/threonine-protein kinase 19 n=1 Tax=Calicophoron daubneyi TaxID=300641 RepID=A0AAV2TQQ8_CALDB